MEKFLIKIKPGTVHPNPDAGRTAFLVPGRMYTGEDGVQRRDFQVVRTMAPASDLLCEYEDTSVTCENCGASFPYKELKADAIGGGDEMWSNAICPKCGHWDCCEVEFEKPVLPKEQEKPCPQ